MNGIFQLDVERSSVHLTQNNHQGLVSKNLFLRRSTAELKWLKTVPPEGVEPTTSGLNGVESFSVHLGKILCYSKGLGAKNLV